MATSTTPDLLQLPLEIVSEIFTHSVTPRPFFTANISQHPTKLPNALPHHISHGASQVCRRWRDIALATPDMWTDIPVFRAVDKPWGNQGWGKSVVRELDLYLARSGALPIHIFLDIWRLDHDHDRSILLDIIYSFSREAHRWRSAVILVPAALVKDMPSQIPVNLHKLNFRIRLLDNRTSLPDYKHVLRGYPSTLKELVMDGYYQCSGYDEVGAGPGPGARAALETFIGLPQRLDDLQQTTTTLKKCIFRGGHIGSMILPKESHAPITFPALKSLELDDIHRFMACDHWHFDQPVSFHEDTPFRHIDALNLESLVVKCGRRPSDCIRILRDIRQAASASSWKLTSLTLSLSMMDWQPLAEVLNILPTLRRLDIFRAPSELLFELTGDPKFLPKLQNLVCRLDSHRGLHQTFTQLECLQRSRLPTSREGVERKLDIEVLFLSPKMCRAAFDMLFVYRSASIQYKFTQQSVKLVGWRRFLVRQLLVGGSTSSSKFIGLIPNRKRGNDGRKTQSPDIHNVNNVLTLLGSLDITSSYDIMTSRIIEVLDAIVKLPLEMLSQDERFNIKSKALSISVRLVEQVRRDGYTWPLKWTLSEDGLGYCLQCDSA